MVAAGALAALIGADEVVIPGALGANADYLEALRLRLGLAGALGGRTALRGLVASPRVVTTGEVAEPDEGNGDGYDCPVMGGYDGAESDGRRDQECVVAAFLLLIPSPGSHTLIVYCRSLWSKGFRVSYAGIFWVGGAIFVVRGSPGIEVEG